jgi:hypothetical protein
MPTLGKSLTGVLMINENLVATLRHGPSNYQVLELPVRERHEIWQSQSLSSQSEALDYIEGHWDSDYKHVSPQDVVDELAARKQGR